MKTSLALLIGLLTTQAWAGTIPDGVYNGQGEWKTTGTDHGTYALATTIGNGSIQSRYTLPDGTTKDWNFEIVATMNGFFTVRSAGADVGEGYCIEKADVCHYEVRNGQMNLEETLTATNTKLYRFGSKVEGGLHIQWQEALDKQ